MKPYSAVLGLVVFVVGTLIVPALHIPYECRAGDYDDHAEARAGSGCMICEIAATPLLVPCSNVSVLLVNRVSDRLSVGEPLWAHAVVARERLARAPPCTA
jgi:hypothetical protein